MVHPVQETPMSSSAQTQAADAQHQALGMKNHSSPNYQRTQHPEAQWFPQAGLGLFLHWGISSVRGCCDLSWGMIRDTPWDARLANSNKLTPAEYFAQADSFSPDAYDPDQWLAAAAKAGFRYAVLTTKHHDGYTLWPSAFGDFGTHTHMNGRDLVRPFVDACHRHGLKVGLYYSPPDWYFDREVRNWSYIKTPSSDPAHPGELGLDMHHQPVPVPSKSDQHEAERIALVTGQIDELLSNYGHIDLMWFDGGRCEVSPEFVRERQPHIVINGRMWGHGDYWHTECKMPDGPTSGWFETCNTWNQGGWGYFQNQAYGPVSERLAELLQLRSYGANLLTNIAPGPDGALTETAYQRLHELAAWMQHSAEAIYDVAPLASDVSCSVPASSKGSRMYCYLMDAATPSIGISCPGTLSKATVLRTGANLALHRDGDNWTLQLGPEAGLQAHDVIAIDRI
jgi:alpha-L-fucosidase